MWVPMRFLGIRAVEDDHLLAPTGCCGWTGVGPHSTGGKRNASLAQQSSASFHGNLMVRGQGIRCNTGHTVQPNM